MKLQAIHLVKAMGLASGWSISTLSLNGFHSTSQEKRKQVKTYSFLTLNPKIMNLYFSSLTLAASFLACAYLTFKSFSPPNPVPTSTWPKDTIMRYQTPLQRHTFLATLLFGWFYYIILILFPPASPSFTCPQPEHIETKFFTWSAYTGFYIALLFIAAPIRLLAYRQLGKSFTFELAKPRELVKTGMYAYVRHPSYPTLLACYIGTGALTLRWGGVIGCWLPAWLVQWRVLDLGGQVGVAMLFTWVLGLRVKEEEEMLKAEFGREWEEYAGRTKMFLPGIF